MPVAAEIYYYVSKNGGSESIPVVFIHGAGGSNLNWPTEIRRLTEFRIFALDLPGHGKSSGRGLQSIDAYTERIIEWMGAVGLHRAFFVGHSMGGAIALTLAKKHTQQVLGLGLVGTGAKLRIDPNILENTANAQTYLTAIRLVTSKAFSSFASPRLVELAGKRMAETRPSVFHGDLQACDEFDAMADLSSIKMPTLVICGDEDQLTPPRYSQHLADQILGAKCHMISNAGHMVMLEKPHEVAQILCDFLVNIPYHPGHIIRRADL